MVRVSAKKVTTESPPESIEFSGNGPSGPGRVEGAAQKMATPTAGGLPSRDATDEGPRPFVWRLDASFPWDFGRKTTDKCG